MWPGGVNGWGMHVAMGASMAGGHAWPGDMRGWGLCMAGGVVHGGGRPAWQEIRPLQQAVRILLECILVHHIIHIHHIIEYMAELFSSILISH